MISEVSQTEEWINSRRKLFNNADPILVEKVIKAFTLLEALCKLEVSFIFKGGTALLLLLPDPYRFSIDIDIIMEEKPDELEEIFEKLIDQTIFKRFEEDERKASDIPKAHYKFYYDSARKGQGEQYILLDILYGQQPYPKLITKPIESPFIDTDGESLEVRLPDINGILGDKLTAFAPATIGIPTGIEKELEIIKQLFDIGKLFDAADDLELIRTAFENVAKTEIGFRGKELSSHDVLGDTFNTSMALSLQGKQDKELFGELNTGIRRIQSYVLERYRINEAILSSSKAAYLTKLLKTGASDMERFKIDVDLAKWLIEGNEYNKLNKIKKTSPEGFYYWYKAIELT